MEADPVVLAGYVLDSPESHPGSAIRMARWIVQHAAIVEAAKAWREQYWREPAGGDSEAMVQCRIKLDKAVSSSERTP